MIVIKFEKGTEVKVNGKKVLLKAYDGWELHPGVSHGDYITEENKSLNGFFERNFKDTTHMLVIEDGHNRSRYQYPNIELPFTSSMHRWENLHFCGGYSMKEIDGSSTDDEWKLLKEVVEMRKPAGSIIVQEDIIKEMKEYLNGKNISYRVKPHFWVGHKELILAQKGNLKEYVDFESVLESYKVLSENTKTYYWSKVEERILNDYLNKNIIDILVEDDWANPSTDLQCIITGLILGFPVESTYAFMTGSR